MADTEEFKNTIRTIVSQECRIEFLGQNFNRIVNLLTETKTAKIYDWIKGVVNRDIKPMLVSSKRPYKEWKVHQLLTFRYPFSIGNTEYRILFVKVKNSIYIEFHLGDHKYYPQKS